MGIASTNQRKRITFKRNAALILVMSLAILCLLIIFATDIWHGDGPVPDEKGGITSTTGEAGRPDASEKNTGDSDAPGVKIDIDSHLASLTLTGQVRARDNGEGIDRAGLSVRLIPVSEQLGVIRAEADGEGRFSFAVPFLPEKRPKSIYVSLTAEGFLDRRTSVPCPAQGLQVDLGSFYLRRDQLHRLRVVDESGEPICGARVRFMQPDYRGPVVEKRSGASGFFTISDAELTQSQFSAWGSRRLDIVHASAESRADHFMCDFDWERPNPIEIPMQRAGIWSSRVLDRETGRSVKDARVALDIDHVSIGKYLRQDQRHATADEAGCFSMPKLTFAAPGDSFLSFVCYGTGYERFEARDEKMSLANGFPPLILLELAAERRMLQCRAVSAESHLPLAGFKVERGINYFSVWDEVTDDEGLFRLRNCSPASLERRWRRFLFLTSVTPPHEKRAFSGVLCVENMVEGVCEIPFKEILLESITVGVQDESGRPVAGAHLDIMKTMADGSGYGCGAPLTDSDGLSVIDLLLTEPIRLSLRSIGHMNHGPHPPVTFSVPIDESAEPVDGMAIDPDSGVLWFTLRRGLLYPDIRVVDQTGKPLDDMLVCGELDDVDMGGTKRKTWLISGRTDRTGFCEMTFPPFTKGILYVIDRPDTTIPVDYGQLLRWERITLLCGDDNPPDRSIQGVVRDEAGAPLKGVMLNLCETESGSSKITFFDDDYRSTGPDGKFSFPAALNRMYRLQASSNIEGTTHWLDVFEKRNLAAGDFLEITLDSREITGVEVDFYSFYCLLKEKYDTATDSRTRWTFDYDVWLQDESGVRIKAGHTAKGDAGVIFRGIPESRVRAVIRAKTGEECRTPILQIERGRIFQYELIDDK